MQTALIALLLTSLSATARVPVPPVPAPPVPVAMAAGAVPGRPASPTATVSKVRVIKPGEKVVAIVRVANVEVSATLEAVDGGAVGDTIRVANKQTRRVLRAVVLGPGQVEVIHGR